MAPPAYSGRVSSRRRLFWRAICIGGVLATYAASIVDSRPSIAQVNNLITFPKRPSQTGRGAISPSQPKQAGSEQMLVRANEINYDHTNDRVAAAGNVQIYYNGATL
jgi:LPS-assembly protein